MYFFQQLFQQIFWFFVHLFGKRRNVSDAFLLFCGYPFIQSPFDPLKRLSAVLRTTSAMLPGDRNDQAYHPMAVYVVLVLLPSSFPPTVSHPAIHDEA